MKICWREGGREAQVRVLCLSLALEASSGRRGVRCRDCNECGLGIYLLHEIEPIRNSRSRGLYPTPIF
ncbi:hypothetical protein MPTK1_7g17570 [Marchantia polymorpha subsp. ruderalis]|uniref:Uncharacterized protein n=2 Tax=Marchantia polymorpha TaxID=3197 RepID=A0AAF6C0T6_MARPO|nr:hypothetical protein MARPO_0051s0095 [Marchantia polymorpha]BBN17870.1 hypothetical protein Mp_7g17570 [Marchantia polymorpha subsp. ruderalis]|eukprot:PTQ38496.1 hypothetical protein MARPO_0051s0095 [Marchantia polymorpha]